MNSKVLKRAIWLCWIFLFICLAIKLLGGNWFEIIIKNKRFLVFGNYIDTHAWARILVGFISSVIGMTLYYLAICEERGFKKEIYIFLFISFILISIIRQFVSNNIVVLFIDIFQGFIIPIFLFIYYKKPKKKYLRIPIGYGLMIVFQFVSLFTKNIGIEIIDGNFLITIILMIDYYILILLFYFYSLYLKKEEKQ